MTESSDLRVGAIQALKQKYSGKGSKFIRNRRGSSEAATNSTAFALSKAEIPPKTDGEYLTMAEAQIKQRVLMQESRFLPLRRH